MKHSKKLAFAAALAAVTTVLAACGGSGGGDNGTIGGKMVLGAAPEFKTRVDGVPGLAKVYDVHFKAFKALDAGGPLTINALKNGQINAANIFTTDPSIDADHFVVLQDPKNLYAAQNVVPLINKSKATPGVVATLNAISAKLTTNDLIEMNIAVITDKKDPATVAKQWLSDKGLDASGTKAAGAHLTVGSANFQESVVLAEVYAEALEAQGASVSTKLNIGSRETYIPGLIDNSIDLVPEYSGVLLQYFDKKATAVSSDDVYAALKKATPSKLEVLDQSTAQDKDAIVVTAATAKKYHLTTIADLAKKG
jgi:osmoprotectant transport system substrate-binding protein